MERRAFLAAAGISGALRATAAARESAVAKTMQGAPEYYELRRYQLRRGPQQRMMDAYLRDALVPAVQRAGIGPIGVFTVSIGAGSPALYVLLSGKTLDALVGLPARLAADKGYVDAATEYVNAPPTAPAFERVDSSLLRAFDSMPSLELPFGGGEAGRRSRVFELRVYESHSEEASRKKVQMFNSDEIRIFRKVGLRPVFFGQTLVGSNLPNLTYMLVYEDMAARDRNWAAFSADPEWRTLAATPGLTDPDIVANISNTYLRPTAYSGI